MALPVLADSGDERLGLPRLDELYAGHALLYANDLHNATPVSGAMIGRTPYDAFLGREVPLGIFRRFGFTIHKWLSRYVNPDPTLKHLPPRNASWEGGPTRAAREVSWV
jgi:hypothetical protein